MSVKPIDSTSAPAHSVPAASARGLSSTAAQRAVTDLAANGYQAAALTGPALLKQGGASRIPSADLHRAATYLATTA